MNIPPPSHAALIALTAAVFAVLMLALAFIGACA